MSSVLRFSLLILLFCAPLIAHAENGGSDFVLTGFELPSEGRVLNYQVGVMEADSDYEKITDALVSEIVEDHKKNPQLEVDLDYSQFEGQEDREPAQVRFKWGTRGIIDLVKQKLRRQGVRVKHTDAVPVSAADQQEVKALEPSWFQRNKIPIVISTIRVGIPTAFITYRLSLSQLPLSVLIPASLQMFGIYFALAINYKTYIDKYIGGYRYHIYNGFGFRFLRKNPIEVNPIIGWGARMLNWSAMAATLGFINTGLRDLEIKLSGHQPFLHYEKILFAAGLAGMIQGPWDMLVNLWDKRSNLSSNVVYSLFAVGSITAMLASQLPLIKQPELGRVFMKSLAVGDVGLFVYLFHSDIKTFFASAYAKTCDFLLGGSPNKNPD